MIGVAMAEIDIYNANLEPIGTMERIQAHKDGQWHQTFHCWVVDNKASGALLFQQRSHTMKNFPGMLDVSAAGHLDVGETVEDGLREVHEELGLPISMEDLVALGQRVEVADQANGQRNREYQSVFLYSADIDLGSIKPEPEEITALVWLPLPAGMDLFTGQIDSLSLTGYTYEGATVGSWEPFELDVSRDSFLPRIQQYYLTALIMAERVLKNAGPVAIS
jgi:isopentenyldiphosphate isomerase